ncbi:hypothetical protein B1H18_06205 [Streptomyces tsukubensis]|uniref:Uncharacterized protein n=1 Tax=Streptomyces tsukubensis TaxID=83656 RepID=A0A1V4ADR1_9ACTN|nr:hypothetical protein B1H18_06205 [Streptomyces tsukubensis]
MRYPRHRSAVGGPAESRTITLDHYAHFMPEAGKKGRGAVDSLLGERAERSSGPNSPDSPQARS